MHTEEVYYSSDFRDHPDFEQLFSVLENAWGALDKSHPRRKTLEIIKILVQQKMEANVECYEFLVFETSCNDPYNVSPSVVWRQIDGVDIFLDGFIHTPDY